MNKRNTVLSIIGVLSLLLVSCRKDKPEGLVQPSVSVSNSGGVYITNEGNFQFGNAKVSYYDIASGTSTEDLYQPANNVSLGDVCESMYLFNGKAYIVLNNSGKVVVVNPQTFVATASISGFPSPRYFLPVSNNKAYVSDLYGNALRIVDLSNNSISGTIPCAGWTDQMALAYGKVFVCNSTRSKLYVINTLSDAVTDSIAIGYGANSIREDRNGKLWVLCGGDQANSIAASLYRLNPVNDSVEQSWQFGTTENPWRLSINGSNDTLYYLNNGVCRMPIAATTLPAAAFILPGTHNFYGLGIDPHNSVIYVSDAVDYVQRGVVYRYKSDGTALNNFLAGIIPGDFCFN